MTTFFAEADGTVAIQVGAAGFFDALKGLIPQGTSIRIPQGGDLIDELSGTLVGTWGASGQTTINATSTDTFAAGVGGRIVWETDTIRGGRRVRGSTFVCPMTRGAFETNGTLAAGALGSMDAAITAMLVQVPTQMRIWSRPRPGLAGAAVPVTRGIAPDKVSWLRSRRV